MNERFLLTLFRDLMGILSLAFTVFACISLVTYSPGDPSFTRFVSGEADAMNAAGIVGAYISDGLSQLFGVGGFFFPLITLILGWALIRGKKFHHWPLILFSGILFLVSFCALVSVLFQSDPFFGEVVSSGGIVGTALGSFMVAWLNKLGAGLILAALILFSLVAMARLPVNTLIEGTGTALVGGVLGLVRIGIEMKNLLLDGIEKWQSRRREPKKKPLSKSKPVIVTREMRVEAEPGIDMYEKKLDEPPEFVVQEDFPFMTELGDYQVPPVSLLNDTPEEKDVDKTREEILVSSTILEKKLGDFGIEGRVVQVLPGPFITLYEFEPGPGVKVSRILSLSDDLALAMRAIGLRILAPVPGKPVVGIEIPNRKRETVYFKEMVVSAAFRESGSKLTLSLGKDNVGQPVVQDLARIPHLLIAGATGSGKSVGINAMICSLLLNASPDEVKMIMVDPKMLELSMYDGIPHLIAPVVTNPKKAASALQWAVAEMESRYRMLAERGVRNISAYNQLVDQLWKEYEAEKKKLEKELRRRRKTAATREGEDEDEEEALIEPPARLPYVVIVIDELADLMMVAPKGVEESLARLAQMARAAGMHLIVATQRPSVDVLTGVIKANFPARISYQVTSRVDSRTILDSMGAEKLLGRGDMLFLPPGTSKLRRIHGAMVSDDEITRIIEFIKSQKQPDYQEDIFQVVEAESSQGEEEEEFDEKYDEAVALVAKERQASISMLQRKLRVGYNRAARMIETMEKEGVVGPSDGIKPREVYVKPIPFE